MKNMGSKFVTLGQDWTAVVVAPLLLMFVAFSITSAQAQNQRYPNRSLNPTESNPWAQSSPTAGASSVRVCVVNEEGFPIDELAIVKLRGDATETVLWGSTAGRSESEFDNVAAGQYTIEASADGFQTQREQFMVTDSSQPYRILITLRRQITDVSLDQILAPRPRKEANKGIAALKKGNAAQAQKHFETAYKLAPGNADINYLMGITLERQRDPANAEQYLCRAISLNPHHSGALLEVGNLRLERADIAGAIAVLELAVLASPKSWPTHESLAVAYFRAQNFEKAHDQAEFAIRESKGAATEPQLLLAETLDKLDRRPEALKAIQDLLRQHPYLGSLPGVRELMEQIKGDQQKILNLH